MVRIGKQPLRHRFIPNPYSWERFASCPECHLPTEERKFPLLIHVDPRNPVCLNKTCRYCPNCDLLIAHQDDLEALLAAIYSERAPGVIGNDYLVIGTVERKAWREGISQPRSPADMQETVHDFKGYREVQVSPGGWFPEDLS